MRLDPCARPHSSDKDAGNERTELGAPALPVLDQRFDIDGLYQVRSAVAAHAAQLGLSAELANDVVIAVHELASNSVRHGPGRGRLRLWATGQALICEVSDGDADGDAAMQPDAGPPAERSTPDSDDPPWPVEPGHGLWLVGKVADSLTVRHDGPGVIATVRFGVGQPK